MAQFVPSSEEYGSKQIDSGGRFTLCIYDMKFEFVIFVLLHIKFSFAVKVLFHHFMKSFFCRIDGTHG